MTPVVFHIEALRELREARDWYAKRGAPEQGLRLIRVVDARVREIARHPACGHNVRASSAGRTR